MTVAEILSAIEALEAPLVDLVIEGVGAIRDRARAETRDQQVSAARALNDAIASAAELEEAARARITATKGT